MAGHRRKSTNPTGLHQRGFNKSIVMKGTCTYRHPFGRPGSDLLSQVLRHSTIGAEAFNDRVRDGIGFGHLAIATRPAKRMTEVRNQKSEFRFLASGFGFLASG